MGEGGQSAPRWGSHVVPGAPRTRQNTSVGLSPPGNFYVLYFSLGSKSFFVCPELYLKLSSMFQ